MTELTIETAIKPFLLMILKTTTAMIENNPPVKLNMKVGPNPDGLNNPPINILSKPTVIASFGP